MCILIVGLLAGGLCAFFAGLGAAESTLAAMTPLLWAVLAVEAVLALLVLPRMIVAARASVPEDSINVTPFPPRGPDGDLPARPDAPAPGRLAA